jgi:hypothetical protein
VEHFLICSEGKKTLKYYFFQRGSDFKLKIRIIMPIIGPAQNVFLKKYLKFSEKTFEFIFDKEVVPLYKAKLEVWFDSINDEEEAINCRTEGVYCTYIFKRESDIKIGKHLNKLHAPPNKIIESVMYKNVTSWFCVM